MKLGMKDFDNAETQLKKEGRFDIPENYNSENSKEIREMAWKRGIEVFQFGRTIYNLNFYPKAGMLNFIRI